MILQSMNLFIPLKKKKIVPICFIQEDVEKNLDRRRTYPVIYESTFILKLIMHTIYFLEILEFMSLPSRACFSVLN